MAVVSSQRRPGTDHVGAHQRQQPGAEHRGVEPAVPRRGRLAPPDRQPPPVHPAVPVGAAGQPPLLPGVARLRLPANPARSGRRGGGCPQRPTGVARERRRLQAPQHLLPGPPGRRPGLAATGRAGNRALSVADPAAADADSGRAPMVGRVIRSGGGHRSVPNRTSNDSGRYPGAGGAAGGCGSARPRVEGQHVRDHVLGQRRQIPLGGGQLGVSEHPLHVRQRHLRIPGHPIRRRSAADHEATSSPPPARWPGRTSGTRRDTSTAGTGAAASTTTAGPDRPGPGPGSATDTGATTRTRPTTPAAAATPEIPYGPP